jgi:N utilization substance protein B
MKALRTAREAALQVLFQQSFQEASTAEELFNGFIDNFSFDNQTRDYALELVKGVLENEAAISEKIVGLSDNWKLERIAMIDKILLQIAIFELCFSPITPTPPKVCMHDILDLAKKYSSADAKNFINGILDQVYNQELSQRS